MNLAIVDTSVIFKWFHRRGEEDVEAALLLRDAFLNGDLSLAAPDLLVYEFANILRFKKGLGMEEAAAALQDLWASGVKIYPVDETLSAAMARISHEQEISAYDASFAALAEQLKATLVTADSRLYDKVRNSHAVMLLAQLSGD